MLFKPWNRLAQPVRPRSRRLAVERLDDRITPSHTVSIDPVSGALLEGSNLSLTATVTGATSPSYDWSVTKDGTEVASGTEAAFAFTPADDGSYIVTLEVRDGGGDVAQDSETLLVENVAATLSIVGPTVAVRNMPLSFTLVMDDPSSADEAGNYSFAIDWNNDGSVDETVEGPSGTVISHEGLSTEGTFSFSVTATDLDDGAVSTPVTHSVEIKAAAVMDDPLNPGHKLLAIGGTDAADRIHVVQLGWTKQLRVFIRGRVVGTFEPVERIAIYAGDGNDHVTLANSIRVPVWEYGGEGNDRLGGAKGNDVLMGEAGDDFFHGHQGNDVIIGGDGADRLIGGPGDDLMIAGTTSYDGDDAALWEISQIWGSTDPLAKRVEDLRSGDYPLTVEGDGATVQHDDDADRLVGASGKDWYFADPAMDKFFWKLKGSVVNDEDVNGGGK